MKSLFGRAALYAALSLFPGTIAFAAEEVVAPRPPAMVMQNVPQVPASLVAVGASFLVIWSNLAVGIVGSEDNPAKLLFFVALLMGLSGAVVARFDPIGMAFATTVTGIALLAALLIASAGPHDEPMALRWVEVLAASVFAAMFLLSAALYAKAARD